MKELELTHIEYVKEDGNSTDRFIIPTALPTSNIKAIDVTPLTEEDRARVGVLYKEYREYVQQSLDRLFKFEDWIEHTRNETVEVNWRTFKPSQMTEIE